VDEPVVVLSDVHKSFGGKKVLDGASLTVERGETVAVLGASGSGKSVTLKTVNGLIPPDRGSVHVLGVDVDDSSERDLQALRRRVSYLFQGGALFDSLSVFENVAFPLREHLDLDPREIARRVEKLLSMVQLEDASALDPAELSGGMRKRVALARALALEPQIILYDEPTTGLDPVTGSAIADLITELDRNLGVTSLVVTHDIPLVRRVAERVAFLDDGRFIYTGGLSDVDAIAPDVVRRFFAVDRRGGQDA